MYKVLAIEPHGDDILCSCSSLLNSKNVCIDILTLGKSRSSDKLKDKVPTISSVSYLEMPEIGYSDRPRFNTHDIHKRFVSGEDVYNYCANEIRCMSVYKSLHEELLSFMKTFNFYEYDFVFSPLGLVHPYHLLVSDVSKELCADIVLYADKPYVGTRYATECLESYLKFNNLVSLSITFDNKPEFVKSTLETVS